MTEELSERLRTALVKAGYTDARNGNPSIRALSRELELNNSRVSRYMYHGSKMQLEARESIAEALGMTVADLDSEVQGRRVNTYSPPPAANLLDHRERTLVNDLINLLAERHDQGEAVTGNAEHPAPIAGEQDDELARQRRRRPGWDFEHDSGLEDQRAALNDGEVGADEIPDDST